MPDRKQDRSRDSAHAPLMRFAVDGDGVLRHIDDPEVANGAHCGCRCPACGAQLVARHGDQNAHAFAHASGSECSKGGETALHLAAKEVLRQTLKIHLPSLKAIGSCRDRSGRTLDAEEVIADRTIDLAAVQLEVDLGPVKPDVLANVAGKALHIEIAVTSFAKDQKIQYLRQEGIPAVEVDMSACRDDGTWESIRYELLGRADNKKWLSNPKYLALRTRADEKAAKLAAESDEREAAREKRIAESLALQRASIPGFKDALRFMERLQSNEEVAAERERLRESGQSEKIWEWASAELSVEWSDLPRYLDAHIPGDVVIPVDRRVWQSGVFAYFVLPGLLLRKQYYKREEVTKWCIEQFGFCSDEAVLVLRRNQRLLNSDQRLALRNLPNTTKVVDAYLDLLVALRIIEKRHNGYYWVIGAAITVQNRHAAPKQTGGDFEEGGSRSFMRNGRIITLLD